MGLFHFLLFFLLPFSFGFPNRSSEQQSELEFTTTEFLLSTTSEPVDDDFCPPNEFFSPCLAHCQRNCTNWSDPSMICLKICVPGCICYNGMVRGPYGNCIQPRMCPKTHDSLQSVSGNIVMDCPVDEHYDRCKAHCQKNCSNWDREIECTQICISGCVCDEGFARGPNGKCVLTEQCSALIQKPIINMKKENLNSCPDGELRSSLQSIRDSNIYCTSANGSFQFCPPTFLNGCVCKKGQIRTTDSQRCIDHRLQPNANEILFIRVPSRSSPNLEMLEESVIFNELFEDNMLASINTVLSVTPTEEINKNNADDEISITISQETSTEDSSRH